MSGIALPLAAWLLTYALHSTLLLCAAALLARRLRGEAWRETLWKAALVGGLLTATAQTVSGYQPPVGRWALAPEAVTARVAPAPAPSAAQPSSSIHPGETAQRTPASGPSAADPSPKSATASTPAAVKEGTSPDAARWAVSLSTRPLAGLAIVVWMAVAALLMVRIAWRQARLWALLRGRTDVTDEAVLGMMAGLRRGAGLWRPVRLTVCDAAPTPLVLGGGEVCVPPRFLVELDPEQQRSALAHELAHLARRDPAWHFAVGVIEAVFFFQPLNRLARLRLRESAEFLCDEWAARQTGSPLGLARCLAEVASWVAPGRSPIPAGTMAMAEGGSPLVKRVQRLTAWRGGGREASGTLRVAGAAVLVLAVAFAAPAVATSRDAREAADEARTEGIQVVTQRPADVQERIIRHPRPTEPLADRWTWAMEEIARRRLDRAWIAYSAPAQLPAGEGWSTDSGEFDIGDLGRGSVNHVLDAPAQDAVMLFSVARNGEVERVAARIAAGFDFGRREVVWLGGAEGGESFAHLRRLADALRNPDLRESLVDAIGVHRGDAMVPYLAAVLGRDGSNGVRREAAQALGGHPGDEALAALVTAVERDGSDDVRREAVEAIGAMRHARSVTLLREIAASAPSAETRRTAAEALGESGGEGAFASLRLIALGEEDEKVSRQAVESMERFPARQAAPVLEQIAWQPGRETVARQAAESLGRFPPPWAVVALDSIARRHPSTAVARQAVESLGQVPGGVPDGYLQKIARTHPDPGVRDEARDQLAQRRSGDGIDPDPDVDVSIDSDPDPDP
jgi:beta-lactamase regulating signal transducer with metallopeptidase domain/HEAT repeat protein